MTRDIHAARARGQRHGTMRSASRRSLNDKRRCAAELVVACIRDGVPMPQGQALNDAIGLPAVASVKDFWAGMAAQGIARAVAVQRGYQKHWQVMMLTGEFTGQSTILPPDPRDFQECGPVQKAAMPRLCLAVSAPSGMRMGEVAIAGEIWAAAEERAAASGRTIMAEMAAALDRGMAS